MFRDWLYIFDILDHQISIYNINYYLYLLNKAHSIGNKNKLSIDVLNKT